MWQPRRNDSAMEAQRSDRPWTPPADDHDDARSDYFSDPFRPSSVSSRMSLRSVRYDSSTESSRKKTKEPAPYTPKRAVSENAPRYPYTPDSSQMLPRTRTAAAAAATPSYPYTPESSQLLRARSATPLSPIPYHGREDSAFAGSPVQSALASCIEQFEALIQTRRPTHEQMEYIVAQFEAMAAHLSRGPEPAYADSPCPDPQRVADSAARADQEYVAEVERYIKSVAKYIRALKHRMEEVRVLNNVQLDVIDELRDQKKTHDDAHDNAPTVTAAVAPPLPKETREFSTQTDDLPPRPRTRKALLVRQQPTFWASLGDALDSFGAAFFDN